MIFIVFSSSFFVTAPSSEFFTDAIAFFSFFFKPGSFRTYNLHSITGSRAISFAGSLAVVDSAVMGYVTMWPAGTTMPFTASLVYEGGKNNMGSVYQTVATNGQFNIFLSRSGNVALDINGYFAPASDTGLWFQPLPYPIRVVNTRPGKPGYHTPAQVITANTVANWKVRGITYDNVAIPTHAAALSATIAMFPQVESGYLTAWPGPKVDVASRPGVAVGLYNHPVVSETAVLVRIGTDSTVNFSPNKNLHLIVDVDGFYSRSATLGFVPLRNAIRLINTRRTGGYYANDKPFRGETFEPERTYKIAGVTYNGITIPTNAKVVVCTLTAVARGASGFVTAWPTGQKKPMATSLLYDTSAFAFSLGLNLALGSSGNLSLYTSTEADLYLDAIGYYMLSSSKVISRAEEETATAAKESHLPVAAVIGIVIASVVVAATILLVAFLIIRYRRAASAAASYSEMTTSS